MSIKDIVLNIEDDLTSVKCQKELKTNSWIHQKVIQDLPLYWQKKFIEGEDVTVTDTREELGSSLQVCQGGGS